MERKNNTVTYPTRYSSLSDIDLHQLFCSPNWHSNMDLESRLAACQEYENRLAMEHNVPAHKVIAEEMDGITFGYQSGNTIAMNKSMLENSTFTVSYTCENGETRINEVSIPAVSWQTMDTIAHEHEHGLQTDNGDYIDPKYSDYDLYRIQGCEKEAFAAGNERTTRVIETLAKINGQLDPEAEAYFISIEAESFENSLNQAALRYNDPNIEDTLARVAQDRFNGVVDPNPSPSYAAINHMFDRQQQQIDEIIKALEETAQQQYAVQNTAVQQSMGIHNVSASLMVNEKGTIVTQDGLIISQDGRLFSQNGVLAAKGIAVTHDGRLIGIDPSSLTLDENGQLAASNGAVYTQGTLAVENINYGNPQTEPVTGVVRSNGQNASVEILDNGTENGNSLFSADIAHNESQSIIQEDFFMLDQQQNNTMMNPEEANDLNIFEQDTTQTLEEDFDFEGSFFEQDLYEATDYASDADYDYGFENTNDITNDSGPDIGFP